MFINNYYEMSEEAKYFDPVSGKYNDSSLWVRQKGAYNKFSDSMGQLNTRSNRYVTQVGGDLFKWKNNESDKIRLGVMVGYGNSRSSTRASLTDYNSRSSVNGYSVGLYAVGINEFNDNSWSYWDIWGQYNWFDNSVKGEQISGEYYSSRGVTGAVEGGYAYKITGNRETSVWLQPMVQAVFMNVRSGDFREDNGTNISFNGEGNIMSRLGIRSYINRNNKLTTLSVKNFEPYIEVNYIHNTKVFGVSMNDYNIEQTGFRNNFEFKFGVNGQLSENMNSWINISHQMGGHSYSDTQAMMGIRYSF